MNKLAISPALLHFFLACELGLLVAGVISYFALENSLPPDLQEFLKAEAERELSTGDWLLTGASLLAIGFYLVALGGLWLFWPPARGIYLWSTLAGFALVPFYGPTVQDGWSSMFGDGVMFCAGVVLALIYWSPLSKRFTRNAELQDAPVS